VRPNFGISIHPATDRLFKRASLCWLFVAQSFHGVDSGGSSCWQVAGDDRDGEQEHHRGEQAGRVGTLDAEEHLGDEAISRKGGRDADRYADSDHKQNLAHDKPPHIRAGCAERHTDANLIGATAYDIGHEAIDANRREEDGKQSKKRRELGNEALIGEGAGDLFIERSDAGDGTTTVDRMDGLLDGSGDGREAACITNFEVAETPWVLSVGNVIEIHGLFR
jgi:hypothetical protein